MQNVISNYVKNIIYFMVFVSMAGMILPGKNFKKYINLCLGLILILVILSPLANIIGTGIPINKLLAGISVETESSQLSDYEKERRQMIKKEFDNQLTEQVRLLAGKEGYEVHEVTCETDEDMLNIRKLDLLLERKAERAQSFIRIEPIKTGSTSTHEGANEDNDEHKKIKSIISDFYNLPVDNIYIKIK